MAHFLRIADMLFNQPLLATETLAASVSTYLNARMRGHSETELAANFNKPKGDASRYLRVSEGTAVLPVMGGLTHRSIGLEALCTDGLSSYAQITKAFDEAMADDSVERIVMHVDSGGGQATGCFDLAHHIISNRGSKPITAYVDGMACSAAYALACAADEVIASPHSDVGSIGVIMIHEDYSKLLSKEGIEVTVIKAGANKGMGNPYTPLSKEAKETMQASIDNTYDSFTSLVGKARGVKMSQQDAKKTEASVYNAQEALDIGLIDKIMTPSEFVAYITPSNTSASVVQRPLSAQAEENTSETEMTEQERLEMEELRAFRAQTLAAQQQSALAQAVQSMQVHADAIGFDATTVVTAMSSMQPAHKDLFMSVIENASTKLSSVAAEVVTLKETHAKELADVKAAATNAVEESDAMKELGGSGDAAADENAEKTQPDARQKALESALAEMIASGKFA